MGGIFSKRTDSPNYQPVRAEPPESYASSTWVLASRPEGMFSLDNVKMEDTVYEKPAEGELIVKVETLSVDAFIRTMLDEKAYHGRIKLGGVVPAIGYGRVLASGNPKIRPGTRVMGMMGARSIARLDKAGAAMCQPMPALPYVKQNSWLGLLGFTTGITAWVGIHSVVKPPKRGDVVIVSAAAGAVGSIAAQLAKNRGARVIGVAGGARKKLYLLDDLQLDGAVDYKDEELSVAQQLDKLAPEGVDFFFDNVGGEMLDDVLSRLRPKARVVICGAVSQYNGNLNHGGVRGPSEYLKLAERGAMMAGFNVMQYFHKLPFAILHLLWLTFRKKIKMSEQVESGIGSFGPAMVKMFTGGHVGKLLVEVSPSSS